MMLHVGQVAPDAPEYFPLAPQPSESSSGQFKLADIFAIIRRQRKIIIPTILAGPILAALTTSLMPRIYEGAVTVKIDNERPKILAGQDLDPVVALSDTNRYLQTLSHLLDSRNLAESVSDGLSLARNDTFIVSMGGKPIDTNLTPAQQGQARKSRVIDLLTKNVSMIAPADNRIVTIKFTSRDRGLAMKIANSYTEKFINQNVLQSYQTNAYARKVLGDQVEQTRLQLQDTEMRAIEYARVHQLIDIGDAASSASSGKSSGNQDTGSARSITTASLVSINTAVSDAQSQRVAAEQRWRTADAANATDLPQSRDNAAMQTLLTQRSEAMARLARASARYRPEQAEVREAQAEVSSISGQIAALGKTIKASIHNEFVTAASQENNLTQARNALASQTLVEQNKRVQLNLISRDADILRQQLADLLERLNQVTAASGVTTNNITLVDRAQLPDAPISPNSTRNLLLGLLAGMALAAAIALAREIVDDTLHAPDDVEGKLKLPLLGVTPLAGAEIQYELDNTKSPLAEAYYSARTTIDYASNGPVHKILMITSSSPNEGKSTTAVALAQDFARIGRRVLLMDMDLRRPSLHRTFGIQKDAKGFTDVLLNGASFDEVLVKDQAWSTCFLPVGALPPNPVHLLSSDLIVDFFDRIKKDYDVIVLDCPPVMGLADALLISRIADSVIFVVEAGRAHNGQAKTAVRRLRDVDSNLIGAIMTKFDPKTAGYGQTTYQYYYYGDYSYGQDAVANKRLAG